MILPSVIVGVNGDLSLCDINPIRYGFFILISGQEAKSDIENVGEFSGASNATHRKGVMGQEHGHELF